MTQDSNEAVQPTGCTPIPETTTDVDNTHNPVTIPIHTNTQDTPASARQIPTSENGRPDLNTVAALSIAPSGVGEELSEYVAQAVATIRESGLPNSTNAMFTNIEGNLDDVLQVVSKATHKLADQGYRTGVVLKLDIRPGFSGQITRKSELVDEILRRSES